MLKRDIGYKLNALVSLISTVLRVGPLASADFDLDLAVSSGDLDLIFFVLLRGLLEISCLLLRT